MPRRCRADSERFGGGHRGLDRTKQETTVAPTGKTAQGTLHDETLKPLLCITSKHFDGGSFCPAEVP